jgi:hypothetical protein
MRESRISRHAFTQVGVGRTDGRKSACLISLSLKALCGSLWRPRKQVAGTPPSPSPRSDQGRAPAIRAPGAGLRCNLPWSEYPPVASLHGTAARQDEVRSGPSRARW